MFSNTRRAVVAPTALHSRRIESIYRCSTVGRECNMDCGALPLPFVNPETGIATATKPISRPSMFRVCWIDGDDDMNAQRGKGLLIEGFQ